MKKLILTPALIVLFSMFFLTSCEKDKPLSELIIGKWEVEYIIQEIYNDNILKGEYKEYLSSKDLTMQLVAGGTGIYSEKTDDYLFSWTFNGNSLSIFELSQNTLVWDIEMNGDKLVWSYNGTNDQDPTVTYKYLFTAKKVN